MVNLSNFDPNAVANPQLNIFGLPFTEQDAKLIIQPVPWEATVNMNAGTARCIEHVSKASMQIELNHEGDPNAWKAGIYMSKINKKLLMRSDYLRKETELYVDFTCRGECIDNNDFMCKNLREINEGGQFINGWVYDHTIDLLHNGKLVGLLGGDHSIAEGFVRALSEIHDSFGILQLDAHSDLRKSYQGFKHSHASVMHNILQNTPNVNKLVQVGIRNYCQEEAAYLKENENRITTFPDWYIKEQFYEGNTWRSIVDRIVEALPQKVYISFDIDGLDPKLCPSTAAPVPGGLQTEQVSYLFKHIVRSGRQIIGFDLSEIGNGETTMDATVGAYMLWELSNWFLISAK